MKTGLVLEGGAMRGMFTCGVLDVMMENKIVFDGIIGVSAGAVFGCNYKSGQIGRALRYNKKYCRDKRYCSFRSLITTGDLYGAEFCYQILPEKLDVFDSEKFNNNPMEFYAVCTDVISGKAVYKKLDKVDSSCLEWMRASASMPLASRIVEVDGCKLLDGGIADSIPVRYFESIGYDKNVVILTQPEDYVKKKNEMLPVIRVAMRKYPNLVKALANRHVLYNETVEYIREKEKSGNLLVIRPEEPLAVGHVEHNPDVLQRVYDSGRSIALKRLDEIKHYISDKTE